MSESQTYMSLAKNPGGGAQWSFQVNLTQTEAKCPWFLLDQILENLTLSELLMIALFKKPNFIDFQHCFCKIQEF